VELKVPQRGKQRVVARGVRKPTSHMGGHVELFSRSKMMIAAARNLDIVTQCELIEAHRPIGEDLDRMERQLDELVRARFPSGAQRDRRAQGPVLEPASFWIAGA